jgi:hypothetical protein
MAALFALEALADFIGRRAPADVLRDLFELCDREAAASTADRVNRGAAFS